MSGLVAGFDRPLLLLLLIAVALLAFAYVRLQRRRTAYAVRFTQVSLLAQVAGKRSTYRRHVPAVLLLLSLAALTVGFAKPEADVDVPRERATVLVAIDVSLSMDATDVRPSRDTAARAAAKAFVRSLPSRFNVGLVSFSGTAAVATPPTQDHDDVVRALDTLSLGEGTAIGEAVYTSLQAISLVPGDPGLPPAPTRLVLLSDGSNTVGRPLSGAERAAREAKVPVSTIAFGTQEGTVTAQGRTISVPVDREALAELADTTGGDSYRAESGGALQDVYKDISSQVGTTKERHEVTSRFTGLGLLLAAGAAVLSLLWTPRFP